MFVTCVGVFFPHLSCTLYFNTCTALIKALEQTIIHLFIPFSTGNRATIPHTQNKGNAFVGYTLFESIKTLSFATITNAIGSAIN